MLFCKAFLGDLIPKGESLGQSKENQGGEMSKQGDQRGRNLQVALTIGGSSKHGEKQRGNDEFRGRPSQHWMMVNI